LSAISNWNYTKMCELVGGGAATVASTKGQLDGAIRAAMGSETVQLIEARLPHDDMSIQLANMTREMARLRGVGFDLPAQVAHVDAHIVRVLGMVRPTITGEKNVKDDQGLPWGRMSRITPAMRLASKAGRS